MTWTDPSTIGPYADRDAERPAVDYRTDRAARVAALAAKYAGTWEEPVPQKPGSHIMAIACFEARISVADMRGRLGSRELVAKRDYALWLMRQTWRGVSLSHEEIGGLCGLARTSVIEAVQRHEKARRERALIEAPLPPGDSRGGVFMTTPRPATEAA